MEDSCGSSMFRGGMMGCYIYILPSSPGMRQFGVILKEFVLLYIPGIRQVYASLQEINLR
jgi:hypothetical protein